MRRLLRLSRPATRKWLTFSPRALVSRRAYLLPSHIQGKQMNNLPVQVTSVMTGTGKISGQDKTFYQVHGATQNALTIENLEEGDLLMGVPESTLRARIVKKCHGTGNKELDAILGEWSIENVPHLEKPGIEELMILLKLEPENVLAYLRGTKRPPSRFRNDVTDSIEDFMNERSL